MEFCEVCDNMLYVKTNATKQLVKYCKHCAFEKIESSNTAIKISQTIYTDILKNVKRFTKNRNFHSPLKA